jgi:hypothetical protein
MEELTFIEHVFVDNNLADTSPKSYPASFASVD